MKTFTLIPTQVQALKFEGTLESVMEVIESFPLTMDFLKRVYRAEYGEDHSDEDQWIEAISYSPVGPDVYELLVPTNNGYWYARKGDWIIKDEGGISHVLPDEIFTLKYQ